MGNSTSKPSPGPTHVWQSETPIRFSQNLVNNLESSSETDSTRAKTLELHIQTRVAEELKRLQEREEKTFKEISTKLSSEDSTSDTTSSGNGSAEGDQMRTLNRAVIQHNIDDLKHKLENRKRIVEVGALDKGVEKARDEVVKCLVDNDQRPLDCWREVERFRTEVRRVEEKWVDKALR